MATSSDNGFTPFGQDYSLPHHHIGSLNLGAIN